MGVAVGLGRPMVDQKITVTTPLTAGARSADLEAFVADVIAKECQGVSFIRAKSKRGRTPDILAVYNKSEFVVECKTISDSEAEIWVKNYSNFYSRLIMDAIPDNHEVIFRSYLSEIDPDHYGYPSLGSYQIAAEIDASTVIRELKKYQGKTKYIEIKSIGQICIIPNDRRLRSSVSIPSISQKFIGRRLVGNAIQKASRQITEYSKPGIAAVSYSTPPDVGALKLKLPEIFNKHQEEYKFLMGVLIFPAQNILKYISPIWIENPYSEFDASNYGLPNILIKNLNPIGI
jgi:hypothetical protein